MPTPGLALVGFMDQQQAIRYLRDYTVQHDASDAALTKIWKAAVANLGGPVTNAGNPQIKAMPPSELAVILSKPYLASALARYPGAQFALVEIAPLLAYQFSIFVDRSTHHCDGLTPKSSLSEIINKCLPGAPVHDPVQQHLLDQSALLKSRSLNIRMGARGIFTNPNGPQAMGFEIQLALPLMHVVRLNGRCYLHNGFHRAYGLGAAGITHAPCLFRDVPDANAAAITPPNTFGLPLLESTNPPTLQHYIRGSASQVQLRNLSRVLHISWSEYVVFDEYFNKNRRMGHFMPSYTE